MALKYYMHMQNFIQNPYLYKRKKYNMNVDNHNSTLIPQKSDSFV